MPAPDSLPASVTVEISGTAYPVLLRRNPRARRVSLRFDAAAIRFALTLPVLLPLPRALAFLDAHVGWMQACLTKAAARQHSGPVALGPGAEFPLRGVPHVIRHDPKGLRQPRPESGILWVGGPEERVAARVCAWLRDEAGRDLTQAATAYAFQLGKTVTSVTVRDTRSRWGSCTARGGLNFSWRLIFAPETVLSYVAAHEAAHLVEMNHSPRFWALVARLHPDPDSARQWLKRYGTGLHRYGS